MFKIFKIRHVIGLGAGMALLAAHASNSDAATVVLTERIYQSYVEYSGGRATEGGSGYDGVAGYQNGLLPASVGIAGSNAFTCIDYCYAGT